MIVCRIPFIPLKNKAKSTYVYSPDACGTRYVALILRLAAAADCCARKPKRNLYPFRVCFNQDLAISSIQPANHIIVNFSFHIFYRLLDGNSFLSFAVSYNRICCYCIRYFFNGIHCFCTCNLSST